MRIMNTGQPITLPLSNGSALSLPSGSWVYMPDNTFLDAADKARLLAQTVTVQTDGGGAFTYPTTPTASATPRDGALTMPQAAAVLNALTNFVGAEIPAGVMNGVNTAFTLAHAPNPALSLTLSLNGLTLTQLGITPDYTLVGAAITMTAAPLVTDVLRANGYKY